MCVGHARLKCRVEASPRLVIKKEGKPVRLVYRIDPRS